VEALRPRRPYPHALAPALATVATAAYAVYSVMRHLRYESKVLDMGVYSQVVWQWSRFREPANSVQHFPHELGDHFSPILALFAPAYWIHPGPVSALIGQAILIGLSIVAVERFARRRLGRPLGLAVALSYALFWGVWSAVDFDFHETAFAAALLAWAVDAADTRKWKRTAILLVGLLFVKEDMGLVVAAFGVWLLTQRARQPGLIAIAGGLIAFVVVNQLVMPAFGGGGESGSDHRVYGELGSSPVAAAWHVVTKPLTTADLLTHPAGKLQLLVLVFGAFLFLGLLSPLTIVTLPQLVERLVGTDFHLWAPDYHYTLAIAPILAMGAADGLARLRRWLEPTPVARAVPAALGAGLVLLGVGSAVTGPPKRLLQASFYSRTDLDRARDAAVRVVPRSASVAADPLIIPHLSSRRHVFLPGPSELRQVRWLVAQPPAHSSPRIDGWRVVFEREGVFVLKRVRG
jgi:uncharacterized membrane protein